MANFDMDSYLKTRFSGVTTEKINEINQIRESKLASLREARDSIAANTANRIAADAANANSVVGILGLDPEGIVGAPVNLAVAGGAGLSALAGYAAQTPYLVDSLWLNKDIPQEVKDARARQLAGQATAEDVALLALPSGDLKERAPVAPGDWMHTLKKDFKTNLQQVTDMETSLERAKILRDGFDLSGAVHTGSKDKLTSDLRNSANDSINTFRKGVDQLKSGETIDGLVSAVKGLGGAISEIPGAAVRNPLGATTFLAENAANLAASGLGKGAQALSNVGYGMNAFGEGMSDHVAKHGGAMPTNEDIGWKAGLAATAIAAEYAGDKLSGVTDLFSGAKKALDAKKVFKNALLEGTVNNPLTRTAGAVTEGAMGEFMTEGYQTWAENAIKMKETSLNDAFEGGAIGAIIGGGTSTVAHLGKELTGTTDGKIEKTLQTRKQLAENAVLVANNDASQLLDPEIKTYDPLKGIGVLADHANLPDTAPEVKTANLEKVREVVQGMETAHERNVNLLDVATFPKEVALAKEEIVTKQAELASTDQADTATVDRLKSEIAFREDAVALSEDKKGIKRLELDIKQGGQTLSAAKGVQEQLTDRIRTKVSVAEIDAHVKAATRLNRTDNMPDIEESRKSADTLMNLAMVSPSSISVDVAKELVSNKNSVLTASERDYLRLFSEARIAANGLMTLGSVSEAIYTGNKRDVGIAGYERTLGQAYEAKDRGAADKALTALSIFAKDHAEKAAIAAGLLPGIRHSGDKQVLKIKGGGWEVNTGKWMSKGDLAANGGFVVHPNSGEFVANMGTEAKALATVATAQKAAYALTFGTKPIVAPITAPTTSVAAVSTAAPTTQTAPAAKPTTSIVTPIVTRISSAANKSIRVVNTSLVQTANKTRKAVTGKLDAKVSGENADTTTLLGLLGIPLTTGSYTELPSAHELLSAQSRVMEIHQEVQKDPASLDKYKAELGKLFSQLRQEAGVDNTKRLERATRHADKYGIGNTNAHLILQLAEELNEFVAEVSDTDPAKLALQKKAFKVLRFGEDTKINDPANEHHGKTNGEAFTLTQGSTNAKTTEAKQTEPKPQTQEKPADTTVAPSEGVAEATGANVGEAAETTDKEIDLIEALDGIKSGVSSVGAAKFTPNQEQAEGIAKIQAFLTAPNSEGNIFVLEGKAGTGKTSLVQEAVAPFLKKGGRVVVAAVSHKAKGVLEQKLNKFISSNSLRGSVDAFSLASLLGMKRDEVTGNFVVDPYAESRIDDVQVLVVDEASMVNAQNKEILESRIPRGAKIIYLGDRNQIAPIEVPGSPNAGKISQVFTMDTGENKHSLVTRVRQGEDSTILPYADHYWNNAEGKNAKADPVPQGSRVNTNEMVMLPGNSWVDKVIPLFQRALKTGNANLVKVMAFNNMMGATAGAKVLRAAETRIREAMFGKDLLEYNKGELLIMTGNFGNDKTKIENSTELVAESAKPTTVMVETPNGEKVGLAAFNLTVKDTTTGATKTIPVLASSARAEFNSITTAWSEHAKKKDRTAWKKFWAIKDQTFAPVAYSYILTTHKAQGSTYDVAVVLEDNIQGAPGTPANTSRILYTAITRASKLAVIVSNKNTDQPKAAPKPEVEPEQDAYDPEYEAEKAASNYAYEDEPAWEDLAQGPVEAAEQSVLKALQEMNKGSRTMRLLTDVEYGMLDDVLAKLEGVLGTEVSKINHFFIQDGEGAPKGTFFSGYGAIAIHAGVFTSAASDVYTSAEQRLLATTAHELSHLRDYSLATITEENDGVEYESERFKSLQIGGSIYLAVQEAMKKDAVLAKWFGPIFKDSLDAFRVPRELYAQLYSLYISKPELMNDANGLTQAYQAIERNIEFHNQGTEDGTQRVPDGSGIPEGATEPISETDEDGSDADPTVRHASGLPGLDALTAEPKSAPDKPYQERNLLVDHFSQSVAGLTAATERPLVAVKDFISSLGNALDFSGFLKDYKATEKQEAVLKLFAAKTKEWAKPVQQLLIHGYYTKDGKYNEDRKSFYQNPFNWMIQKDAKGVYSIEENVNTSLVYAAFTALLELADAPVTNNDKTINAMLGRDDEAAVPDKAYEVLGTVGVRANLIRGSSGKTAAAALGMKVDNDGGQNLLSQLEGGMGGMVEALLLNLGLVERQVITSEQMNEVLAATNEIDGVDGGRQVKEREEHIFIGIARDPNTGEFTDKVKQIIEATKGSNNVLDRLFSVETQLKYPSFTPTVSTQKTTKTGQQVPSLLTDTNNQNSSQANYARQDMWKLLEAIDPMLVGAMAGIQEITEAGTQLTKRRSIKAKNDGLWRELNRYHDYMKDVLLASEKKLEQAIYFDYSAWLQQRVGIATNVINPQTSKAHRALFFRESWKSEVDMNNKDMMDNFFMRVGEGFGVKTERDTVEASLTKIEEILDKPVIRQAISALQVTLNSDKGMSKAEQDNLLAAVKIGKENFHSLDALVALAHYKQAQSEGKTTFTTHLQAEVDGVANGPILSHALFGAAKTADELNTTMERGGIYAIDPETGEARFNAFNEWKSDPLNHDLYEHTITSVIQSIAKAVSGTWKEGNANAVFFFTGMLTKEDGNISSDGRNIIKGPVTEMVFGSGIPKSLNHMAELFVGKIYDVMEKSANGDEKYPPELVAENYNILMGKANKSKWISASDVALWNTKFALDAAEVTAVKKAFGYVFNEPVKQAIEGNFAGFLTRRDTFTLAAEFTHGVYSTVYSAMRQELIDKLIADELTMPGTGIASTTDKGKRVALRDLSKNEERQLEKQLSKLFPVVQTLFSIESNQPKSGLRIGKTTQTVSDKRAYTTKVSYRTGNSSSTSMNVRGLETVQEGPGVGMLPLLVHSIDSYISHATQMGMELLNIHDAVIAGLMTIHEAAEKMNKNTFHALLNYSPMMEMYNAMEKTVLGLDSVSLSEGVSESLAAYLGQFAVDNKLEGDDVLQTMLQNTKAAAAKADAIKLEAMKSWAVVNQYARENSSYEVTPEDQDKISELAERVTDEVRPTTMRAVNSISERIGNTALQVYTKSRQADNMPDVDETVPPVTPKAFSSQEIYTALGKGNISDAFDAHLNKVLTNIVEKLHGAFGSLKASLLEGTANTAMDYYSEALATGKAPFAFSLGSAGFVLSDRQTFVAEQIHASLLAALESNSGQSAALYTELSKLFRETRSRLEIKDFHEGDWTTATAQEIAQATALYNRVFNEIPSGTEARSNYLAEFAALGLAHEGFNKLLQVPTKMAPPVMQDRTIAGMLGRLFNKVLQFFNGKITHTVAGQNADQKLKALVMHLIEIERKREITLNADRHSILKFIDKQALSVRMGKKNIVSKLAHSSLFGQNKNVFIAAASGVVATLADSQVGLFFRNIDAIRQEHFSGIQGITAGFLSEMNGPKPTIQALLRGIKYFEGQRKKIIGMTNKFVLQGFDNQGKDMDSDDKRALTHVFLHTGAHTLLDHFDTAKMETLLKDPKAMAKEIADWEVKLNQYTPAQKDFFIEQSRALGYYLVTGNVTHELMLKNASNIASMYLTSMEGSLSGADKAEATKTIDALSSLYAMTYTKDADKARMVRVLAQEHARSDGGNGVRLVLLSHKEMEQQSKDRLFSSSDALMVKGYVPEIYNPHTDIKAANEAEGKILEDLGYVKGAMVGNDPTDTGATAKHLYIMRDGGKLPWLSGVFSFTGMRSKGTKHHGKNAHNLQQTITQDKQNAIAQRNPAVSGSNFDPLKAKTNHMAPLLNNMGQAVNYQYLMKAATKELLERDTRFDTVMGSLNGSIYDKENSAVHNRKAVQVLFDEFDKTYNKEPKAYLRVSASSTDPELREIYLMLPQATKDAIREIWGKDEMMVRANNLDIAFGYRKRSISTVFDSDEDDRNFAQETFVWWTEAVLKKHAKTFLKVDGLPMTDDQAERYSKRAALYVRRSENVWQALVKETKDIFVVKSGITALNNIVSNMVLLKLYGVSSVSALRDMRIAWVGAQAYSEDTERLFTLQTLLASKASTTGSADIKREIRELQDAIDRNPVKKLIENGLMPTIVEDVGEEEDIYSYKSKFVKDTAKYTDRLNKHVKSVGKQVYMAHDTKSYKTLAHITQLSDFVGRYALYQHLTTRKDNPISEKFAIQEVSDAFINYDVPMHRDLQYLDDMGIMMFTKYFLRIQRVIRGRFKHAPGKVAMLLATQGYLDWLPGPLDSSIIFRFGNNPLGLGALQFPGSLDEMMTTRMGLSLFK